MILCLHTLLIFSECYYSSTTAAARSVCSLLYGGFFLEFLGLRGKAFVHFVFCLIQLVRSYKLSVHRAIMHAIRQLFSLKLLSLMYECDRVTVRISV